MNAAYSDTASMKKITIVCSCGRSTYEMKAALPRLDVWCMFAVNHFTFVPRNDHTSQKSQMFCVQND